MKHCEYHSSCYTSWDGLVHVCVLPITCRPIFISERARVNQQQCNSSSLDSWEHDSHKLSSLERWEHDSHQLSKIGTYRWYSFKLIDIAHKYFSHRKIIDIVHWYLSHSHRKRKPASNRRIRIFKQWSWF